VKVLKVRSEVRHLVVCFIRLCTWGLYIFVVEGEAGEGVGTGSKEVVFVSGTQLHVSELWREVLGVRFFVQLRAVWRVNRLLKDRVPIQAGKPGVGLNLLCVTGATSKAGGRVLV